MDKIYIHREVISKRRGKAIKSKSTKKSPHVAVKMVSGVEAGRNH